MATVLTVTANTLIDFLGPADLVRGKVCRVPRFEITAGGKGLIESRVLVAHGHRVLAAGFAGGLTGELLREQVRAEGIEPLFAATASRTRIGFQALSPRGAFALLENGFQVRPAEQRELVRAIRRRASTCQLVLIGGSVPDPSCQDLYRQIGQACAGAGIPVWLDSYGPALERALSGNCPPQLVKLNRQEAPAAGLLDRVEEVHLTDGPRPVRVRGPWGRFRVSPPRIRERNPVGSGDSYLAALAHARLSGFSYLDQLRYAAAAGAANAELGAVGRIAPADAERLVAKVVVEPLDEQACAQVERAKSVPSRRTRRRRSIAT